MGPLLAIKSGTTSVQGATVKGDFRYFSASTLDLGPTSTTGLYAGIDAPNDGYTVYQIGGPNGLNARVATNTTELNTILITAGATGSTLNDRIIWATNTNSIFINSGNTAVSVYYFGGAFTLFVNNTSAPYSISLNADGTPDTSFDIGTGFNNPVNSIEIQSDGKILVGGYFTTFTGATQNYLIRLNSNGSKDTSFDIGTGFDSIVLTTSIQSDGKILVGGYFYTYQDSSQFLLIRLNSDGSKDTSFDLGTGFDFITYSEFITSIAIQSDGKVLAGGYFFSFSGVSQNMLIRLNSDGSKDESFDVGNGFDDYVSSIKIQSDGKILVGGNFTTYQDLTQNFLIRLNSDGSKDTSFDIGSGFNGTVSSIEIQSDGKILVGGNFSSFTGTTQNRLIRLNSNGSKDTSFNIGSGFNSYVSSIEIQSDGKILVGEGANITRLNSDGSRDTSLDTESGFDSTVTTIAIQSNGKILVGGFFTLYYGLAQNRILKTLNYLLDTSFDTGSGFNGLVNSIVIQSDGKLLVGGEYTTFKGATENRLIRLNSNGSKDTSFNIGSGFNGSVSSIGIQSDGKILVVGSFSSFSGSTQNRLIRLNSNGSKDTSFDIGTGFNGQVFSIAIQSDGKILVGGSLNTFTGSTQNRLIRLNSNGSKDTSFDIGTGFNNTVHSIAIQSDGKVLAGGTFSTFSGVSQNRFTRLNSDGSRDTSFNIGTGFVGIVLSIAIQSDGKILVGGSISSFSGSTQNGLIRLNSDGSKDTSFNIGTGFDNVVYSTTIQSDEKILVGGAFTTFNGINVTYNIVLNSDGSVSNNSLELNSVVLSIAIQQ